MSFCESHENLLIPRVLASLKELLSSFDGESCISNSVCVILTQTWQAGNHFGDESHTGRQRALTLAVSAESALR